MNKHRRGAPRWLLRLIYVTTALTLGAVAGLMVLTVRAYIQQPFNVLPMGDTVDADAQSGGPNDLRPPAITIRDTTPVVPQVTQQAADEVTPPPDDRTTILVMGLDRRPGEGLISRTDTMMLLSLDESDQTIAMLSIPRDLWVNIPEHGENRINTAYVAGGNDGGAAAGAAVAMQTVANTFDVTVHHYALIDFSAVISIIDTVGGVTVNVPYTINDPTYPDMNYGFDPFYIEAGTQVLDGETALKYMRTRHTDNDFYRAERQQQVIFALRSKVLALGLTELLRQAPTLYQQMSGGIFTDMSLQTMVELVLAAGAVDSNAISSAVLNYDYVSSWTSPGGASALRLDEPKTAELIATLFK